MSLALSLEKLNSLTEEIEGHEKKLFKEFFADSGRTVRVLAFDPQLLAGISTVQKKGDSFDLHSHKDSVEIIILIKGGIAIKFDNKVTHLTEYRESCTIKPGITHSATTTEDNTEFIWITIPPEKQYLYLNEG